MGKGNFISKMGKKCNNLICKHFEKGQGCSYSSIFPCADEIFAFPRDAEDTYDVWGRGNLDYQMSVTKTESHFICSVFVYLTRPTINLYETQYSLPDDSDPVCLDDLMVADCIRDENALYYWIQVPLKEASFEKDLIVRSDFVNSRLNLLKTDLAIYDLKIPQKVIPYIRKGYQIFQEAVANS